MLGAIEVLTDYPKSLIVGIDAGDKFTFPPDLDHLIASYGLVGYAEFDIHEFTSFLCRCLSSLNHNVE